MTCPRDRRAHPADDKVAVVEIRANNGECLESDPPELISARDIGSMLLAVAVIGAVELAVHAKLWTEQIWPA